MTRVNEAEPDAEVKSGGGTWPLADLATVKMRGGDIPEPGSRQEEIVLAAWKMYRYISARAMREGEAKIHVGSDWHTWTGNIESAAHMLWPAGTPIITGESWPGGFRMARDWLLTTHNLVNTDAGRPGTSTKKEGMVAPRLPHWLVRDKFAGAPEGMRLPDLDDNGRPLSLPPPSSTAPAPAPAPAPVAAEVNPKDWWCPIVLSGNCQLEGPYTREGLGEHIQKYHKYRHGGMMYEITINDAVALREDRAASGYGKPEPAPEPPPPLEPPARSILEMGTPEARAPEARRRDRSQRHAAAPPATAPAPVGSTAAQARVFAGIVDDLERDNIALRRRVSELEEELRRERQGERKARLHQTDIDAIAHRVLHLMDGATG
jgi:hypothetical protein